MLAEEQGTSSHVRVVIFVYQIRELADYVHFGSGCCSQPGVVYLAVKLVILPCFAWATLLSQYMMALFSLQH